MKKIILILLIMTTLSCSTKDTFTAEERALIGDGTGIMRVLKTNDPTDSLQLRKISQELTTEDLQSETYTLLKERMLATVNDPNDSGVGIAAPQVGVMRRLVAVERRDRDEPVFEFYANPRIERYSDETNRGNEGCLSIPDRMEAVDRARSITLSWLDEATGERREEVIEGFTAVIFQHEVDHLDGILYIDRLKEE